MSIDFDTVKDVTMELKGKAIDAAQVAVQKTRDVAAIAKAKLSITTEKEKIRKAHQELGKLYYRDYVLDEEMDSAEYLPWCDKITESRAIIEDLQDLIENLKIGSEGCAPIQEDPSDYADVVTLEPSETEK